MTPREPGTGPRTEAAGQRKSRFHNPVYEGAPAMCMCPECREKVRALRCPFTAGRTQCGDYRGHRGEHTRLIATAFLP